MSLERIQQAIWYMEEHLLENISYVETAEAVHMSSFDFHRTFRFITGMTANEYIRSRRLALAAQELQSTDIPVIEAAYKYGYESPESFSRAFARFHGSTPRQARQNGAKLRLFNPLVIKIILEGGCVMDYRLEHREGQRFLVQARAFPNEVVDDENDRSIPAFWEECSRDGRIQAMAALCREGKRDLYGLCDPLHSTGTHFNYSIGVLLDEEAEKNNSGRLTQLLDSGYALLETKPADYAVFKCLGPNADCIGETWSKFFKEFCPQTGYVQTEEADYELYRENGEEGVFCELWIPVRKK